MMNVGIVGVGNMGGAMARRLLALGWTLAVRDVVAEREQVLRALGATVAASASELASISDAVIVAVVDAPQVHEVLFGLDGVAAAPRRPACVLLCPTIAPVDVERVAAALRDIGIGCIEAPMSGGPGRASDGTMSLMLAGDTVLLGRHRALLEALSSQRFVVGVRLGDGARTKLVNNLLAAINLAGAAEAFALAERLGLDLARTLDVVERSSGQSWIASDRLRRAFAGDLAPRAHTALLAKDTRLALAMAAGARLPLGEAAAARFAAACAAGFADLDDASLFELARRD